jgi:hypothetical protein
MRVPGHQRRSYAWRWTAALAGLAVLAVLVTVWLAGQPEHNPAQAANFTVNVLTDAPDTGDTNGNGAFDAGETDNGGGGSTGCDSDAATSGSQCTLRAAIYEANRNGDTADTISFGSLSGTITLTSGLTLPVGDSDVSVAGADGLAASTTINGNGTVTVNGGGVTCFTVTSASNVIRDLNITGCAIGVLITGDPADANAVRGNTIYNNTSDGVQITGGDNNTVGGTSAADRNIIRDNGSDGVGVVAAGTDGNVVEGNCIGTTATCSVAAPNGGNGVYITGSNTTVGGTAAGAGNTIAFNGSDGVDIAGGTGNVVTRNVMFLNAALGIASGVAAPTVTGCADAGGGMVSCTGNSTAGYVVDVYRANSDPLPEGDLFLCTTVAGGGGAWGCTFGNPGGGSATATQRDPSGGNTSSFYAVAVGIPAGPVVTATPTPTNTPIVTPTVTGTPPTSTPTVTLTPIPGLATATATTSPTESVTLVGGTCNPVASTYPDDTAITTIGNAVSPSGILISIWWFNAGAGVWMGYSPQFPQASDLTAVDRLEAIFICVSSAGSWSRPLV